MNDGLETPVAKRQRLEAPIAQKSRESRLFRSFRTIGLVSPTAVPFTSVPLGQTTFQITTAVGKTLQTYDLKRGLTLVFLSTPPCPEPITATVAYKDRIFVAWGQEQSENGSGVWIFKRGRLHGKLERIENDCHLGKILIIGQWIVGQSSRAVEIWKHDTLEHYTTINISGTATVTCICTLPTFLNKVFVGKSDGVVDIYNVSTSKLVYSIAPRIASRGGVTCLEPTLAVSLLAVAYADGALDIIDVETEELVLGLTAEAGKPINSISFRTDGMGAGEDGKSDGVMATASSLSGDITFWDLTKAGRVAGVLRAAHELNTHSDGINKIEFLSGQPVIVSSGQDNAIRTWVFDQAPFSPIPRPLHERSGHSASITNLKFLPAASDGSDANGKWLLSAGRDRSLWGFSLRKDGQNTELSQGHVKAKAKKLGRGLVTDSNGTEELKCPPIIDIACSLNRDGGMGAIGGPIWTNPAASNAEEAAASGWESIVTAHEGDMYARTWFWGRKRAGRWALYSGDDTPVTSVAVTSCGTFAVVGSAGGAVNMYNLQSGLHRQKFPPKLKAAQAKVIKQKQAAGEKINLPKGHTGAVTGIVVDNLNQVVLTTSLDGQLIIWDFISGRIRGKIKLPAAATAVRYNSVSGLMSLACEDLCVRLLDIETHRMVRELWGSVGQINDHCFSHDGRWIFTSSMDSIVRIYDLATSHLIDAFKTSTCTSMACSSTGEFLATAHAGQIGINIWSNKSLYSHVSLRQIDESKEIVDLSGTEGIQAASQIVANTTVDDETDVDLSDDHEVDQLDQSLLTLSLQPQSRWQTLLNLETIRQRNKPIEPPQKLKAAPFFLGSSLTNGVRPIDVQNLDESPTALEQSRISRLTSLQPVRSTLTALLEEFEASQDPGPVIAYMTDLSPSAADLDIRSLTLAELPFFVHALTRRLEQRRDFELVSAWMAVVLKLHGEFVSNSPDVQTEVVRFQQAMQKEEGRLSRSVGWTRGVMEFLRSSR